MIEVVYTVYSVLSYGDVVKHQAVYEAVLHPPDDLLLAQNAGGGHADVLEGQTVNISRSSSFPIRVGPGLESCSKVELRSNNYSLESGALEFHKHTMIDGHEQKESTLDGIIIQLTPAPILDPFRAWKPHLSLTHKSKKGL